MGRGGGENIIAHPVLQGASHATNPSESKVSYKVQEVAPKSLEQGLPDSVHPTKGENPLGMGQSHATGESIVPEGIQKVVPESLEHALPDSVRRFCHCHTISF
jgi:hypothetical protein